MALAANIYGQFGHMNLFENQEAASLIIESFGDVFHFTIRLQEEYGQKNIKET